MKCLTKINAVNFFLLQNHMMNIFLDNYAIECQFECKCVVEQVIKLIIYLYILIVW